MLFQEEVWVVFDDPQVRGYGLPCADWEAEYFSRILLDIETWLIWDRGFRDRCEGLLTHRPYCFLG